MGSSQIQICLRQSVFYHAGILPAIKHGTDYDHVIFDSIIYGEREPRRKHSVVAAVNWMNPSIKDDGIYFGRQHIEKINADPWFLIFVKEGSS